MQKKITYLLIICCSLISSNVSAKPSGRHLDDLPEPLSLKPQLRDRKELKEIKRKYEDLDAGGLARSMQECLTHPDRHRQESMNFLANHELFRLDAQIKKGKWNSPEEFLNKPTDSDMKKFIRIVNKFSLVAGLNNCLTRAQIKLRSDLKNRKKYIPLTTRDIFSQPPQTESVKVNQKIHHIRQDANIFGGLPMLRPNTEYNMDGCQRGHDRKSADHFGGLLIAAS